MLKVLCASVAAALIVGSGPASGFEKQSRPSAADESTIDAVDQLVAQGRTLFADDRSEEALEPLTRALNLSREGLGEGPYTAMVLTNLGLNYASTGRIEEAEAAYDEAAAINGEVYDEGSIEQLPLLINRGQLYANTARPGLALPFLQEAHSLCSIQCAPDDQRAAYIRKNLEAVYRDLGLHSQADAVAVSTAGSRP